MEFATGEFDIRTCHLQKIRRALLAPLDDAVAGVRHHHGAHPHRAARMRAAADRREVGIAGDELHLAEIDREPLGDELGEARLVPLSGGERAEHHLDAPFGQHAYLGALARRAGVQLDVVPQAYAAAAPARAGLAPYPFESRPVGELERP